MKTGPFRPCSYSSFASDLNVCCFLYFAIFKTRDAAPGRISLISSSESVRKCTCRINANVPRFQMKILSVQRYTDVFLPQKISELILRKFDMTESSVSPRIGTVEYYDIVSCI